MALQKYLHCTSTYIYNLEEVSLHPSETRTNVEQWRTERSMQLLVSSCIHTEAVA